MPRQGRLHIAGGYYHVMGRGLERRRIFQTEEDKEAFLLRLMQGLGRSRIACMAWAIMPNHYHLLLRVSNEPLMKLMQPLLGAYGSGYNRRHKRVGYVFQNRYKSILCEEEHYFLQLVRYIHLNPVKAKLIVSLKELAHYPWTGHGCVLGSMDNNWQNTEEVLARFTGNNQEKISGYLEFISDEAVPDKELAGGGLIRSYGGWESLLASRKEHQSRIGDERILGSSGFVQAALKCDELGLRRAAMLAERGWDMEKTIDYICQKVQVEKRSLMNRGRDNSLSHARALICYFLSRELCLSGTRISQRLGISESAVSHAAKRGEGLKLEMRMELPA